MITTYSWLNRKNTAQQFEYSDFANNTEKKRAAAFTVSLVEHNHCQHLSLMKKIMYKLENSEKQEDNHSQISLT